MRWPSRSKLSRQIRRLGWITRTGLVLGLAVALLLATLAWWRQYTWGVLFYLVVGWPYLSAIGLVGLVVGLLRRRWKTALGLGLCLVVPLSVQLRLWVADDPPQPLSTQAVTVMSANLEFGAADAQVLLQAVREQQVDLLALQELTPQAWQRLQELGITQLLPYQFARPASKAQGSALLSRFPLVNPQVWPNYYMDNLHTQLRLPSGQGLTFVGAHPAYPVTRGLWHQEADQLRRDLAALAGPVLVAGDFNATWDQPPLRRLAADGFASVVDQAGAGWVRTWGPRTNGFSLVGIDHVLVRGGLWGQSLQSVRIPGSDHRAVVARVRLPQR